jgi:hypothetical protein
LLRFIGTVFYWRASSSTKEERGMNRTNMAGGYIGNMSITRQPKSQSIPIPMMMAKSIINGD